MAKRRYRYRAYPTGEQTRSLARLFGCCRVVFNDYVLERRRQHQAGEKVPTAKTVSMVTTLAKRTPQRAWLSEVSSVALQQSVTDAQKAYDNFFSSVTGKRRGPKVRPPSLKSRRHRRQSARFTRNARFKVRPIEGSNWAELRLPGIGDVRYRDSRPLPSDPSSVTVSVEPDGTYWVSFVVEVPDQDQAPTTGRTAAIDLGIADLAVIVYDQPGDAGSAREKIPNPKPLKAAQRRLARQQRVLSRKQSGSKNREKARVQVAKTHRRVADVRLDHHHKLANRLVAENDLICLETLDIAGMTRKKEGKRSRAKSIYDAGWATLTRLITEKAETQSRTVMRIDQWTPTSQTCSVCETVDGPKPLDIREWQCRTCGTWLDRDYNAAVNIMVAAGQAETRNAQWRKSQSGPTVGVIHRSGNPPNRPQSCTGAA